jgi:CheY-like chemotaxis protein
MRVLLVDDDPVFLESAARLLRAEAGFTVVGRVRSGREAIEQAVALLPDLVLMDVEMPGMDGLETTRRLKALPFAPRVLLVSSYEGEARRLSALSAGADEYIGKWEFPWRLTAAVTAAIWTPAEERERRPAGSAQTGEPEAEPAPRALIVDDDPTVASLLADMLVFAGYLVETVSDARAALDRIDAEPFDVILSDVRMPEMDGPAFYAELVRRRPALAGRVALITGDLLTDDIADFLARTGVPSLGKPFTVDELHDVVRRLLGRRGGPPGSPPQPCSAGACSEDR